MKKRIVVTAIVVLAAIAVERTADLIIFPSASMDVGVAQLEDSESAFHQVQVLEWGKMSLSIAIWGVAALLILLLFWKPIIEYLDLKGKKNEKDITENPVS
jgi:hypothetical protein